MQVFDDTGFHAICHTLADAHPVIASIGNRYGFPRAYTRPMRFVTLVQIILEQQVSLASARAAFDKLSSHMGSITAHGLLQMDAASLKSCGVSRQKAGYLHHLAACYLNQQLVPEQLITLPDDEVRSRLMQVKGIGPWTADIVLMLCLQRTDVFPLGDIALINSMRHEHSRPDWPTAAIEVFAHRYAPYRTVAAFCYWHAYICRKKITVPV